MDSKTPMQELTECYTVAVGLKTKDSFFDNLPGVLNALLEKEKEAIIETAADAIVSTWMNRTGRTHESFTQKEIDNVRRAAESYYNTKYPNPIKLVEPSPELPIKPKEDG